VRLAAAQLTAALQEIADARALLVEAETLLGEAKRRLDERVGARDAAAADLGLAAWVADLSGLTEAVAAYRVEVSALEPALMAHLGTLRAAEVRSSSAAAARTERERAAVAVEEARTRHARLAAELAALEATVGAEVADILTHLEAANEQADAARDAVKDLDKADRDALEAKVRAAGELERSAADLADRERDREEAIGSLGRLAMTRLLGVAVPDGPTDDIDASPTRAVEAARTIEEKLGHVESGDSAWERSSKGLLEHVQSVEQALISHGYQASAIIEDGLIVVHLPFQGRTLTMAEFGEVLGAEVLERQSLLGAREREVIENHLVGESPFICTSCCTPASDGCST
jgi:hypothetical protein